MNNFCITVLPVCNSWFERFDIGQKRQKGWKNTEMLFTVVHWVCVLSAPYWLVNLLTCPPEVISLELS